eukprot:gene31571-40997_t
MSVEDGSLSVLAAWSDLATDKAGSVCNLAENVAPELSSTELTHLGKVNPTDLPTSQVIQILRSAEMPCAQSIEFQSLVEEKFTVLLPDELFFEQDATLQTLADVGGVMKHRAVMVSGLDVLLAASKTSTVEDIVAQG